MNTVYAIVCKGSEGEGEFSTLERAEAVLATDSMYDSYEYSVTSYSESEAESTVADLVAAENRYTKECAEWHEPTYLQGYRWLARTKDQFDFCAMDFPAA